MAQTLGRLRRGAVLTLASVLLVPVPGIRAAQTNSLLGSWLATQTNIQSWSADFVQTRSFKSLAQPLTATGHVWFAEPNRFHWELGSPPQTIAVRSSNALVVIYPRLKRAERFPVAGQSGQWRDALALLETGFPRSEAELTHRFNILSQNVTGPICQLVLQPKSAAARKMMPEIKLGFNVANSALESTELQFADGSTMHSQFTNAIVNPKIDPELFDPKLGPDYKIVEPLKTGP